MMLTTLVPKYVLPELRRRASAPVSCALEDLSNLLDVLVPVVVEQIVTRVDLTAIVLKHVDFDAIVAAVDLPEIIRESTGAMTSQTVQGARMQGIAADDALARAVDRLRPRRSRVAWATRVSRSTTEPTPTSIPTQITTQTTQSAIPTPTDD